jgi:glycosyltransferase involved in cell wall biosynthesis
VGGDVVEATIAICSRGRPDELRCLLRSIERSTFRHRDPPRIDVLVVVNGPEADGYDPAELAALISWPLRVVREPRPGVTIARNTAIRNRCPDARWLICVDDDETVTPSWLESHLLFASTMTADVATGPVLTIVPGGARPWIRALWVNVARHATGEAVPSFLGGNVLFRGSLFGELDGWYDETQALSTGDDADLGHRLVDAGFRIVWNDHAIAWERVHDDRLSVRWIVKRFLSYGGGRAIAARRAHGGVLAAVRAERALLASTARKAMRSALRCRDPHHLGQALALTCELAGFAGGTVGWRVRDYRDVTTRSAQTGAPAASQHRRQPQAVGRGYS